jgi:predicted Rossmann fold nucleotide-binding protein DprA/Smf involved in DNA uptake
MHSDDYVGWLALALTPGLGARMAGKLLAEFGSPDAIFSASLTALEAQRLPAAVAQALHSRRPLSDAAKELTGRRLPFADVGRTRVPIAPQGNIRPPASPVCPRKR